MHSISYNRNGYIRNRGHSRPIKSSGNNLHSQQSPLINLSSNPNSIAYSMQNMTIADSVPPTSGIIMMNNEGMPIHQKSESDSISSGDSNDNVSPPETPHMSNVYTSSSNTKGYKHRNEPNIRHKMNTQNIIYGHMIQPSQSISSSVQSQISLANDIIMSPNISPQQQLSQSQQQTTTMNVNLPGAVTSTVLITNKPTSSAIPAGFSIAGNPSVLFQPYPPQPQHHIQQGMTQSQLNAAYQYHQQHLPINNRGSILTTPHTPTSAPQQTTFRLPPYHMQPNGEVIYPFAYMQQTAMPLSRPSTHQPSHTVVVPSQSQTIHQSVPNQSHITPITAKQPSPLNTYQPPAVSIITPDAKAGISCFNCGSNLHTGRECPSYSMEDATRIKIYKLDYNSTLDTKSNDLDNGSGIESTDSSTSTTIMK